MICYFIYTTLSDFDLICEFLVTTTHMHLHNRTHSHTHTHTHACSYIHTHMHMNTHAPMCTYAQMYAHMRTHIHTCAPIHTPKSPHPRKHVNTWRFVTVSKLFFYDLFVTLLRPQGHNHTGCCSTAPLSGRLMWRVCPNDVPDPVCDTTVAFFLN